MAKPKLKKQIVAAKLQDLSGNMAAVGRSLGVSRQAVFEFIGKHPELQALCKQCRETFLDDVETSLYSQALDGNTTACIFVLKTLGRNRGYSEKQESVNINIDWESMTDEELKRIAAGEHPSAILSDRSKEAAGTAAG